MGCCNRTIQDEWAGTRNPGEFGLTVEAGNGDVHRPLMTHADWIDLAPKVVSLRQTVESSSPQILRRHEQPASDQVRPGYLVGDRLPFGFKTAT